MCRIENRRRRNVLCIQIQFICYIAVFISYLLLFYCGLIQAYPGDSGPQICFGKEKHNLQSICYKMMSLLQTRAPSKICYAVMVSVFQHVHFYLFIYLFILQTGKDNLKKIKHKCLFHYCLVIGPDLIQLGVQFEGVYSNIF